MKNITNLTRPTELKELIGMETIKQRVDLAINGARLRGMSLPSFIVEGPPGTGKSTIAGIISSMTGGEVHKCLGSDITDPQDIYDLAAQSKDNDVWFIEEAHTIGGGSKKSKYVQAVILEMVENGKLLGGSAMTILEAPKVCIVLPTTSAGKLSEPLRTRCSILHTHYYTIDQIKQILLRAATKLGIDIAHDDDALTLLAKSSRGSPRIAVMQRLDGLANVMAVNKVRFNEKSVREFFKIYEINEWGLEGADLAYCKALYHNMLNTGRPASKKTMEQLLGMSEDTLTEVVENYLIQIGAVNIETKGRVITDFGCEIIGMEPIRFNSIEKMMVEQSIGQIDMDKLEQLLRDPNMRKGGMKVIAGPLGLTYGPDNPRLQAALMSLGYEARRRAGIVPINS
jgi:Holliday junction DNA helicase RuvB